MPTNFIPIMLGAFLMFTGEISKDINLVKPRALNVHD
jgi:hypothetical protein